MCLALLGSFVVLGIDVDVCCCCFVLCVFLFGKFEFVVCCCASVLTFANEFGCCVSILYLLLASSLFIIVCWMLVCGCWLLFRFVARCCCVFDLVLLSFVVGVVCFACCVDLGVCWCVWCCLMLVVDIVVVVRICCWCELLV